MSAFSLRSLKTVHKTCLIRTVIRARAAKRLAKSQLRLVTPATVMRTVAPTSSNIAHDCPGDVGGDDAPGASSSSSTNSTSSMSPYVMPPYAASSSADVFGSPTTSPIFICVGVNVAAVGARDKPVGLIFKFRSRRRVRAHLAIKTDAHHRNKAAVLVVYLFTICSRKMRRRAFSGPIGHSACAAQ